METLFYRRPEYHFYCNCYHYETYHYTTTDSEGNTHHHTRTDKVYTFRDHELFNFCSWRDTSGLFLLNTEENLRNKKKSYIKLELDLEFEFADDVTKWDFNRQKENMINRNKYRDTHMEFSQNIKLPGMDTYNFIKIGDKEPACLNCGAFLFFTFIIPVMELYKMYVESCSINQDYTIKKVVSSRYNLNTEEARQRFDPVMPKIVIYDNETNYNNCPQEFNKVYDMPSAEELEESEKFSSSNKGSSFMRMQKENPVTTFNKDDGNQNNQNKNNYPAFDGNANTNFNSYANSNNGNDIEANNNLPSRDEVYNVSEVDGLNSSNNMKNAKESLIKK